MTVLNTHTDADALTLSIVAEFDAGAERVWQIWEDPRQLERWWGPPTWPASFPEHDFVPGGRSHYFMTGPDGEKMHGWWRITSIEAPRRFEFDDGFADENGDPTGNLGVTHGVVTLEETDGRTRMTAVTTFDNPEQLEQMLAMGMEEGMTLAMGQVDAILAENVRA